MVNENLWNLIPAYRRVYRWKRWAQLLGIWFYHKGWSVGVRVKRKISRRGPPVTKGELLRRLFERLGPAWIKWAQVLSTRPEMPDDVLRELKKLQDRVPFFPYGEVEAAIKRELGASVEELFLYFEKEPIAAASISQVHRAVLKDGQKVAVKIQRPNIQYNVESDIDIMEALVRFFEWLSKGFAGLGMRDTIKAFRIATLRELDFIIEGRSAEKFAKLFANEPWVHIPKIYWDHTSKRVLTMEFIDGVKIDQTEELNRMGCDRRQISIRAVRAFLKQIYEGGFFHADPHPANVFIMKNNVIALLDFGMVGQCPQETLDVFADLFLAILARDVNKMLEKTLTIWKPSEHTDVAALKQDLQDFVDRAFTAEGGLAVNQSGVGSFMDETIYRFAKHRLKVPQEMIYLGKVMMYAEGTARMLDPEFDFLVEVTPYVRKYVAGRIQRRTAGLLDLRNPTKALSGLLDAFSGVSDVVRRLPRTATSVLDRIERGEITLRMVNPEAQEWNQIVHRSLRRQTAALAGLIVGLIAFGVLYLGRVGPF
ncbi:MAG: AarF/ABC1/UbiB kinase family protein [Halobacteria archaeon]